MWRHGLRLAGVLCFSKYQLRHARTRFCLQGVTEIHHVIPRACAAHPSLRAVGFEVEDEANFVLMPNVAGARLLNLRADRPIHHGHPRYNAYVCSRLDAVETANDMNGLLVHLHRAMRKTQADVPW